MGAGGGHETDPASCLLAEQLLDYEQNGSSAKPVWRLGSSPPPPESSQRQLVTGQLLKSPASQEKAPGMTQDRKVLHGRQDEEERAGRKAAGPGMCRFPKQ